MLTVNLILNCDVRCDLYNSVRYGVSALMTCSSIINHRCCEAQEASPGLGTSVFTIYSLLLDPANTGLSHRSDDCSLLGEEAS